MECVAYMRVSTEKQAEEGHGLDSQKRDIINYCAKNELTVKDWYVDDGYTGSNMERPQLQRLISDCTQKRVQCVVAFKLDRLSRSMIDGIYIIERIFMPNNVDFKCVHDSVEYNSPMGQAYTQMMAVFAQLDKNTMLLRMRGGMLERVKAGYWMGGGNKPYCYKYDANTGILVPIPERAEQARQALELYIQGYSEERIANMLGYAGDRSVRNVLTSRVNIGMIPYKGNEYKGLHEPIFDLDRYELGMHKRKQRVSQHSFSSGRPSYMLSGLCFCGVCGCAMRYQKWGSSADAPRKIYCMSRNKSMTYLPNHNPDCDNVLLLASDVEKYVEAEVLKISLRLSKNAKIEKQSKLDIMRSQLSRIQFKLKRLYGIYAEGNDTVLAMIRETEQEKTALEKEIENEVNNAPATERKNRMVEEIKKVADIWEDADNTQKNLILKSILDKVIIGKGNIEIRLKNF